MKNTIPKKIPLLFSRPQKIPTSFIDPKKSLLAKMSDPKKSFGPPPSLKYVSGAPGNAVLDAVALDREVPHVLRATALSLQFLQSCVCGQVRKVIQFIHGKISIKENGKKTKIQGFKVAIIQ